MEKNKIEVGEYIRTKEGIIGKLENINEFRPPEGKYAVEINEELYFIGDKQLEGAKHSKNIIDLIEVGDIVIGKDSHLFEVYAVGSDCVYINNLEEFVCVQDIKSIVTKEQMKEMEYRV